MYLSGFMAAEYDELPEPFKKEVQTFADVNLAWLSKVLSAAKVVSSRKIEPRARASGFTVSKSTSSVEAKFSNGKRICRKERFSVDPMGQYNNADSETI